MEARRRENLQMGTMSNNGSGPWALDGPHEGSSEIEGWGHRDWGGKIIVTVCPEWAVPYGAAWMDALGPRWKQHSFPEARSDARDKPCHGT
eukprot:4615413-Pyramimonas_sp.AAC.1